VTDTASAGAPHPHAALQHAPSWQAGRQAGWLVDRHLVDRHLVDRHLVDRHLVDRHLVDRHLVDRQAGRLVDRQAGRPAGRQAGRPTSLFACSRLANMVSRASGQIDAL